MRIMFVVICLIAFLVPAALAAQEDQAREVIRMDGEPAEVVSRSDDVVVLEGVGENLDPRHSQPRARWFMIQDSSLGAVFKEPSGLKESTESNFDGDIDIQFSTPMHAIEIKSLVFDTWNNFVGTYRFTEVRVFEEGNDEGFNPIWSDFEGKSDEIWATITYVSRVRFADGTIKQANAKPVYEVAKSIDPEFQSAEDAVQNLRDLFRELFKRMGAPGGSLTLDSRQVKEDTRDKGR